MKRNLQLIYNEISKEIENPDILYQSSVLLQYLEKKTRSLTKDSKSRGSFANIYAIYVLVEDFYKNSDNKGYDGMQFTHAMTRQRELPFGQKLQNHAFNHRCNMEFRKFFGEEHKIIIRDEKTKKYKINSDYLRVKVGQVSYSITAIVLRIIQEYVKVKLETMENYIDESRDVIKSLNMGNSRKAVDFVMKQLDTNVDARIFEVVSYTILAIYYSSIQVSFSMNNDTKNMYLQLFKTGRTNANDGGIDFIMKPLGRVFQVTETLNFNKYFLDIDKLNRFPITFVIKTKSEKKEIYKKIKQEATKKYKGELLTKYLSCVEEVITINELKQCFDVIIARSQLAQFMSLYESQMQLEYNLTT